MRQFPGPVAKYVMKYLGSIAIVSFLLLLASYIHGDALITAISLVFFCVASALFTIVLLVSAVDYHDHN